MFLLRMLTEHAVELERAQMHHHKLARDLLGLHHGDSNEAATSTHDIWAAERRAVSDALTQASPARAQLVGVGVAVAACEELTSVHTWRHVPRRRRLPTRRRRTPRPRRDPAPRPGSGTAAEAEEAEEAEEADTETPAPVAAS